MKRHVPSDSSRALSTAEERRLVRARHHPPAMKKRVKGPNSMESLLSTLSKCDQDTRGVAIGTLPQATMSGRLSIASIDNVWHANADKFASCWVELRGDTLTFIRSESKINGRGAAKTKLVQAAFCSKVSEPPAAMIKQNAELRAIAGKLMAKTYLAVYTTDSKALWLEVEASDLSRWQQARLACAEPIAPRSFPLLIDCARAYHFLDSPSRPLLTSETGHRTGPESRTRTKSSCRSCGASCSRPRRASTTWWPS